MLAAIGIGGTIMLLVAERSREIGIRLALGAERMSIAGLILGEALMLAGAGAGFGLAGAFFLTRLLSSLIYGVGVLDLPTFIAVPSVIVLVALLASLYPARRGMAVDPIVTLRAS